MKKKDYSCKKEKKSPDSINSLATIGNPYIDLRLNFYILLRQFNSLDILTKFIKYFHNIRKFQIYIELFGSSIGFKLHKDLF